MPNLPAEEETEEVDVTELIARIEALEKENTQIKKDIQALGEAQADIVSRVTDCEDSIDALAEGGK